MESFKTISKNVTEKIEIKKSKFIANIFYVEELEQAEKYIKEIKNKYKDAKHNVFAYAIESKDGRNNYKIQ